MLVCFCSHPLGEGARIRSLHVAAARGPLAPPWTDRGQAKRGVSSPHGADGGPGPLAAEPTHLVHRAAQICEASVYLFF